MRLKIIDGVNLREVLGERFEDKGDRYECFDDYFGEFISVNKDTREIRNYGFSGMLLDMASSGLIESY